MPSSTVIDIGALGHGVGMGGVAHMQDDVGLGNLLQGGAEGGDQLGRQLADEAHRVGQDGAAARGQPQAAHGRVERGEELVAGLHLGAGQALNRVDLPALV